MLQHTISMWWDFFFVVFFFKCEVLSGSVHVLPFSIRWQKRTSAQARRQKCLYEKGGHHLPPAPVCVCACACAFVFVCVCCLWFWDCFVSDEWCKGLHVKLRNLGEFLQGERGKGNRSLSSCVFLFSLLGRWAHINECWKKKKNFFLF